MLNQLLNFLEHNKPKLKDKDSKMKNLLKRKPNRKLHLLLQLHKLKLILLRTKRHNKKPLLLK